MFKSILLLILAHTAIAIAVPLVILIQIFRIKDKHEEFFISLAKNLDYVGGTALFFTDGKTISAIVGRRFYEQRKLAWAKNFINWMFQDEDHCLDAYKNEFL